MSVYAMATRKQNTQPGFAGNPSLLQPQSVPICVLGIFILDYQGNNIFPLAKSVEF